MQPGSPACANLAFSLARSPASYRRAWVAYTAEGAFRSFVLTRALNAALATITYDQRTAIVLFDVEGYDYQEIAEMTGVSLGTVKSRIHRGRLALRDRLADRMDLFRG